MRIRITPTEPPILVESVIAVERDGEPCWLVVGVPQRAPWRHGTCQERVRYVVPQSYTGMRPAA